MRILLIEDEVKIANSIRKGLQIENFAVDLAHDGTDGFDLASSEEYDVIILDRMLPGIDGLEICKKLRDRQIHTPILMLTARGEVEDKVEGLNNGADDYLSKPFAFTELLARVKALTRRPKVNIGSTLSASDLTLDTNSFEVIRGEQRIVLSGKEFSLLEYLLRHKGTVINKEQIISHVWDYDSDVLPNSVEVYMTHLRNKIDKPFKDKAPLIKTIRGFGYRID